MRLMNLFCPLNQKEVLEIESLRNLFYLKLEYVLIHFRVPICKNIRDLIIWNSQNLTELDITKEFQSLQTLDILNCRLLETLLIDNAVELQTLNCYNCVSLQKIPETINTCLRKLRCYSSTKISSVPTHLTNLDLINVSNTNCECLPEEINNENLLWIFPKNIKFK